jgi:hypothetical protein
LRKEKKYFMIAFITLMTAFIGYLIFITVNIVSEEGNRGEIKEGEQKGGDPYSVARPLLLYFICATFVVSLASLVHSMLCYRIFGKGLLQHRQQYKLGTVAPPTNATEEEAIRISMMDRSDTTRRQTLLD